MLIIAFDKDCVNKGVIYLNPHCSDPLLQVYKHEFTHWLENSRWYKSFVAYLKSTQVYKTWIEEYHGGEEAYSAEVKKDYEAAGLKCDVTHEIVANFVAERVLGGMGGLEHDANGNIVSRDPIIEEALTKFAETHMHWYDAILTHIKDIIATIKNLYYKVTGKDAKQQSESQELDEIYRRLVHLKDTVNTKKAAQADGQYMSEYISSVDKAVVNFVDSVLSMNNKKMVSKRKLRIGRLSRNHAQLISDTLKKELDIDLDVSDYELWLDGSGVEHIEDRHGKKGKADQSMSDIDDYGRIQWVADNAEHCSLVRKQNGEVDYDSTHNNIDNTPSPQVKLIKKIGDIDFFVVECVPDSTAKRIYVKSAYKRKSSNGQVLNLEQQSSQQPTSEMLLDGIATTSIVSKTNPKVNKKLNERLSGDDLLNAEDLIEEIKSVGAEVDQNGYVTVYHRTSQQAKDEITSTGQMTAKEDGVFFSTKPNGQYTDGYGDKVVKLKMPVEMFVLDDVFDDEAHLRVPLEHKNATLDVSDYLVDTDDGQAYVLPSKHSDLFEQYEQGKITREEYQLAVSDRDKAQAAEVRKLRQKSAAQQQTIEQLRSAFKSTHGGWSESKMLEVMRGIMKDYPTKVHATQMISAYSELLTYIKNHNVNKLLLADVYFLPIAVNFVHRHSGCLLLL